MNAASGTPTGDPPPARTRLPSLGRRGGGWVSLQFAFFLTAVGAGVFGAAWPAPARHWLAASGGLVALAGAALLVGGGVGLGRQLTPFPRPIADGALRQDGVYGMVRHPIYGGALLLILCWALISSPVALLPLVLATIFLDAKRRREEAWLVEQYPGYADYRLLVRRRFLPWLW